MIKPTFVGEPELKYWENDGDRYRAYPNVSDVLIDRIKDYDLEIFLPGT